MTSDRFVAERHMVWSELRYLTEMARTGRRLRKMSGESVQRLADLHREVSADLALARLRFPALAPELGDLVRESHAILYQARTPRYQEFLDFLKSGFPRQVRSEWRFVLIGVALLMGPFTLAMIWGILAPGKAMVLIPDMMRDVVRDGPSHRPIDVGGRAIAEGTVSFTYIYLNNLRVSLLTFAGGVLLGVGAGYILMSNGTLFGAMTGVMISYGHGLEMFALTVPHGILELSSISIGGAAGARMGWALIDPGPLSRSVALGRAAQSALRLVVGVSVVLLVAAFVEGYVTPSAALGPWSKIAIGLILGSVFWAYVILAGREGRSKDAFGL